MEIKEIVKEKYGQAALRVTTGGSSCCAPQVGNKFMSAFIRGMKPAPKECCGPACCS